MPKEIIPAGGKIELCCNWSHSCESFNGADKSCSYQQTDREISVCSSDWL